MQEPIFSQSKLEVTNNFEEVFSMFEMNGHNIQS